MDISVWPTETKKGFVGFFLFKPIMELNSETATIRWDKLYYYGSWGRIFLHFFIHSYYYWKNGTTEINYCTVNSQESDTGIYISIFS